MKDIQVEPMEVTPEPVVEVKTDKAAAKEPTPQIVTVPIKPVAQISAKAEAMELTVTPTPTVSDVKPVQVLAETAPKTKPAEEASATNVAVDESVADKASKSKKGKGKKNKKE